MTSADDSVDILRALVGRADVFAAAGIQAS